MLLSYALVSLYLTAQSFALPAGSSTNATLERRVPASSVNTTLQRRVPVLGWNATLERRDT